VSGKDRYEKYLEGLEVIEKFGREDIAMVYLGKTKGGALVEFVESVQPPFQEVKNGYL
jgi:23S rRNA (adenine2503-C2)-methyltransferase